MAIETVGVNEGTDKQVAADLVGGAYYQVTKQAFGADGTATLVEANVGLPVAGVASEAHIGQVGGYSPLITVTPTLDTNAYSIGDIFFTATSIAAAMRANDKTGVLQSIYLIDKSDQAPTLDLYFWDTNVSFGTINVAPSISDADAASYMGHESIAAGDWKDLGNARVAQLKNLAKIVKPLSGAANLYITGVIQTALTFANGDLVLRCGFLDD